MLPNIPEMIYTWLALSRLEALMIPVNTHYKSLALRYIIDDSSATAVIYEAGCETDVISATNILNSCEIFVGVGPCKYEKAADFYDYKTKPLFGGPYSPDGDDTAVMFYSGAATGPAKYAKYSNSQVNRNTNDFLHSVMYRPRDIIFSQYPLTHFISYISVLNAALSAGCAIAITAAGNSADMHAYLHKIKPACMLAEPGYFPALNKENKGFLPESLRFVMTGGGRLKKNVQWQFSEIHQLPVFKIYGMVEAGPILTVNTNTDKPYSIGTALGNVTLNLMKGRETVGDEVIGEICVMASMMTHDLQELLKNNIIDGWYHSGDLGRLDMDGYLYFVDRKAYIIHVRGFEVYPEEIETALIRHPQIRDVVVVGVPVDEHSESIHAHIIAEDNKRPSDTELTEFLKKELPRYQIPEKYIFVNHFPKSATGKVVRQALKT
jgi:acyl-CoA synthetase (AMP-forming)/AMP-acid ligase II